MLEKLWHRILPLINFSQINFFKKKIANKENFRMSEYFIKFNVLNIYKIKV